MSDEGGSVLGLIVHYQESEAELQRERDQARSLACEYASRLAEIERLLDASVGWPQGRRERVPETLVRDALAVASGVSLRVPLRVLVEWALCGRGWEQRANDERWYMPDGSGWVWFFRAVEDQIEREEAVPAAEATT